MNIPVELKQSLETLIDGMKSYIEYYKEDNGTEPYNEVDVAVCSATLEAYLAAILSGGQTDASILGNVEKTVKELNVINDKCGYALIETDQREEICDIIINGARMAGYSFPDDDEDITFEWREW